MPLTHKFTLICEDIRQEINGKWMVAGLYTHSIATAQLPFMLPGLAFFIACSADSPGQHKFKIQLRHLDTGALIAPEVSGNIGVQQHGPVILPVKLGGLQFRALGSYTLSVEIEGQPEPFVTEFVVELLQRPPLPMMPGALTPR